MDVKEQRALIRHWYDHYLLRSPKGEELEFWAGVFAKDGAEKVITGITDSKEGQKVRRARRTALGL